MRVTLNVPYAEKNEAKSLGARWDPAKRTWYVEDAECLEPFLKWMPDHLTQPHQASHSQRYIAPHETCFGASQIVEQFAHETGVRLEPTNVGAIAKRLNLDYVEVPFEDARLPGVRALRQYGEMDLPAIKAELHKLAERRARYES